MMRSKTGSASFFYIPVSASGIPNRSQSYAVLLQIFFYTVQIRTHSLYYMVSVNVGPCVIIVQLKYVVISGIWKYGEMSYLSTLCLAIPPLVQLYVPRAFKQLL